MSKCIYTYVTRAQGEGPAEVDESELSELGLALKRFYETKGDQIKIGGAVAVGGDGAAVGY